jgi:hypothetical protein
MPKGNRYVNYPIYARSEENGDFINSNTLWAQESNLPGQS